MINQFPFLQVVALNYSLLHVYLVYTWSNVSINFFLVLVGNKI